MALTGKVALITGAATGIGLETAKVFIKQGIKGLAIVDQSNLGEETAKELLNEYSGVDVLFVKTDVSNEEQVNKAFKKTVEKFGQLDVVVNAAGIYDEKNWQLQIQVNLIGVINCTIAALEHMGKDKNGNGGVVINISSIVGIRATGVVPIYSATKFAVQGLSRCFGKPEYYKNSGVSVITVCPGITTSNMYQNIRTIVYDESAISVEALQKGIEHMGVQTPENAAEGILKAVLDNENGSLWVAELGTAKKIDLVETPRI